MTKKYVVHLAPEERETPNIVIRERKSAAWKVQRSHALLMCEAGPSGPAWPDSKIAEAFGGTTRSLESWRKHAVEEGPLSLLERKPEDLPRVTPKLQGDHQARLRQLFVEALAGWREVFVTATRTAIDWAKCVQQILDHPRYAVAERITLICDNLNTHTLASLYQAFPPEEALRSAKRIEIVHTPKHGSWLNIAESELSALTRQCLDRRLPEQSQVASECRLWNERRNQQQTGVDWQFKTADARIKLRHLYPKIKM